MHRATDDAAIYDAALTPPRIAATFKGMTRRGSILRQRDAGVAALLAVWLIAGCDARTGYKQAGATTSPASPQSQPAQQPGQAALPTVRMQIGARVFTVEIARSESQLETGLMFRSALPADHGMIFVFNTPQQLHFWMKDTRIPLDVIFLDGSGKVDSIHTMKPFDLANTSSTGLCQYAIELNAGVAQDTGIQAGERVAIPAEARVRPAP